MKGVPKSATFQPSNSCLDAANPLHGQTMVEKRNVTRHRVLKAGKIEFGGGVIDCTVRNVSNEGAALQVATPFGIPGKFTLAMPADSLHFACRVIWRKGLRLGVTFDSSHVTTPNNPVVQRKQLGS